MKFIKKIRWVKNLREEEQNIKKKLFNKCLDRTISNIPYD